MGAVAMAAPTEVEQRTAYTSSLNVMAESVMNWYGSLVSVSPEHTPFQAIPDKWDEYRSQYPKHITQIQIKSTDLTPLSSKNEYQFSVNSLISYQDDGAHTQSLHETFLFTVPLLSGPIIKNISRSMLEDVAISHTLKYSRSYFKPRKFAYAWLAYLDGVDAAFNASKWLDTAQYSMTMRGKETIGSIAYTLAKRQHYLTKGGHLLRSLDVKKVKGKVNTFVLDLVIEWKGENHKGTPVLAKIHQEIEYKILADKSWSIITIKEHHLLPDTKPWIELLC